MQPREATCFKINQIVCLFFLMLFVCPGDAGSSGRHRSKSLSAPGKNRTHRPHRHHMIPQPDASAHLGGEWSCPLNAVLARFKLDYKREAHRAG